MKQSKNKIISIVIIVIAITTLITSNVQAISPDFYEPNLNLDNNVFLSKAGIVLGWIKYIGILVSVVALTIIGIKYMFSSVEGKAEYKKTMIPYVIGCFLLAGISIVIHFIESIANM